MSLPSLQLTLMLHICVLWGLVNETSIPDAFTNVERMNYDACFDSVNAIKADVTEALNNHATNINKAWIVVITLQEKIKDKQGTITTNMRQILELHLVMMFCTVATYRLWQWNPDSCANPDLMYNVLHETIVLLTFYRLQLPMHTPLLGWQWISSTNTLSWKSFTKILYLPTWSLLQDWRAGSLGRLAKLWWMQWCGSSTMRYMPYLNIVHKIHQYHTALPWVSLHNQVRMLQ